MSERNNIAVHRTHCCVIHGCKYNDEHCPVANGQIKQEYVCRDCNELKGWNCMDEVKAEVKKHMSGLLPYVTPEQYAEHWADDPEPFKNSLDMLNVNFPKNIEQQAAENRVVVVDNMQAAEKIKDGMGYPLLVRSMGVNSGYAYITNDEAFIIHANRKLRESPICTIGITDDDRVYVGEIATNTHMADQKYVDSQIPTQRHVVFEELFEILANKGGLAALTRAEEIFNTQEREINNLMEQRTDLDNKLESMSNDNVFQRENLISNENQIAYLTTGNQDLLIKLRTADNDLRLCEEQADKLEDNHIRAINTINHLETRIHTYREVIEDMEKNVTQMEDAHALVVQRMSEENEKLKEQVDVGQSTIKGLSKELNVQDNTMSAMIRQFDLGACLDNVPENQQGDMWDNINRRINWEYSDFNFTFPHIKTIKTNFDNIGGGTKDSPHAWGALPTAKDYIFVEGKGEMTTLDKLHSIEDSNVIFNPIYNIEYCNSGVGIVYYDADKDVGDYMDLLGAENHYPTFEDCIDAEYERLKTPVIEDDEEDKFNTLCRGIYKEYYGVLSLGYFKPWTDNSQLLDVVDIVRKRTGIGLHVMGNEDVYDGMRNYVKEYGNGEFWEDDESYDTDDWTLTKEEQFNTNCAILVDGYNIFDCQPVTSDFDPYNNIEDLAPILPIVVGRVQEDFTLGEIMYDLPREDSYNMNVFDNMRHYIERHMQPLLDILDNDVDPR